MLKTYRGRYEYGKLVLPKNEQVLMPDTANIIITILDDDIIRGASDEKFIPAQRNAAHNFLTAVENIGKEDFTEKDEEAFAKLERGEYKLKIDRRESL